MKMKCLLMHVTKFCNARHNCKRLAPVQTRIIIPQVLPGVMYILINTDSLPSKYCCEKIDKSVSFVSVCCILNYQETNNHETVTLLSLAYLAVKDFSYYLITFTIFRKSC